MPENEAKLFSKKEAKNPEAPKKEQTEAFSHWGEAMTVATETVAQGDKELAEAGEARMAEIKKQSELSSEEWEQAAHSFNLLEKLRQLDVKAKRTATAALVAMLGLTGEMNATQTEEKNLGEVHVDPALGNKLEVESIQSCVDFRFREEQANLISLFENPDFLRKLEIEYGCDSSQAENIRKSWIDNINTVSMDVLSIDSVNKELAQNDKSLTLGFYDPLEHKIHLAKYVRFISLDKQGAIRHELIHAATRGKISPKAEKIFKSSYKNQGFLGFKNQDDNYYGNSIERLERKRSVEKDLEKLEIKKYGEIFTKKHYEKMMEAYKKGELSRESNEFIKRTSSNFADFEKIFNEIAQAPEAGQKMEEEV